MLTGGDVSDGGIVLTGGMVADEGVVVSSSVGMWLHTTFVSSSIILTTCRK